MDCETTTFQKGNPFSDRNQLALVGFLDRDGSRIFDIQYSDEPYGEKLRNCADILSRISLLIGFNCKFDLHWLKRYGLDFRDKRVWDCQLVEFILDNQKTRYPSLNGTCEKYGLGQKLSHIEEKYWSQGIDTNEIPFDELVDYLKQDLQLTWDLYQIQRKLVAERGIAPLVSLHNQDLLVLQEMEYNGIKLDLEGLKNAALEVQAEIEKVENQIQPFLLGFEHFNLDSNDHVSKLLYGGTITVDVAVPYEHTFKTGPKAGTSTIRNRWTTQNKEFPRLVDPLPGSELIKDGYWSTDEKVLLSLKPTKEIKQLIKMLLKRAELEKLRGTYYEGLPKLLEEMDWRDGFLHGTLNQCVAVTGRLSATKPNQQNFDRRLMQFIRSRFG